MSKDGIVLVLAVLGVAVLSHSVGVLVTSVIALTGLYITGAVIVRMLGDLTTPAYLQQKKYNKIIDKAANRQELTLMNVAKKFRPLLEVGYKVARRDPNDVTLSYAVFAKSIGVLPLTHSGVLPGYLYFIVDKKLLYEVKRKHGSLISNIVNPLPEMTSAELLRPIAANELHDFIRFCTETKLTC